MNRIFSHISIRTKMIFMVIGILVLAIIMAGLLIRGIVYRNIVSQKMTTVDILTASLVHDIKYDYDAGRLEHINEIIAKFMTYYRIIQGISFYDTSFINRADSHTERIGQTTQDQDIIAAISMAKPRIHVTSSDWKSLSIHSVAPIFQGSRIAGAIAMEISIQDIQATMSAIDHRIAVILIITIIMTSFILFIILRSSILIRLSHLINLTNQIAAGNYNIRVNDDRQDEIGKLGRAFDQMSIDLRRSKEEIDNYNKHLEERVNDATARLQKAYEDLKNTQSQLVLNEKMASLGLLIAGIAHEINTPVGAIRNVLRNLEKKIVSLPKTIETFKNERDILPFSKMVMCLEDLIQTSSVTPQPVSYKEMKVVETLLMDKGIGNSKEMVNSLSKINFTDPEKIIKYTDCLRISSFFSLFESIGSIVQAARISETSSQKIAEIVRALKYYAYTDKDNVEMTQINESIQTAMVLLKNRLKHTVKVSTDLDPALPAIPCTCEIHQVWTNLLNNACDAIEELGEDYQGKINISTRKKDDHILITVTDNGNGIPEDKINKIFDPFFTTKDIGKGTGLGLSIVSGILKRHYGIIRVESRRGCTVFEVSLPIAAPSNNFSDGKDDGHIDERVDREHCPVTADSSPSGDAHVN